MEQVLDDIVTTLWTLDKPELIKVCHHLKCRKPAGEGFNVQTRRALMRMVEVTIGEIEDGEDSLVFQQFIKELQSFVKSLETQEIYDPESEKAAIELLKQ